MHQINRMLSLIIVFTLFIQPVFAEDVLPAEVGLSAEIPLSETTAEANPVVLVSEESYIATHETSSTTDEYTVTEKPSEEAFVDHAETTTVEKATRTDISEKNITSDLSTSLYVESQILVTYKDTKINLKTSSGRRTASRFADTKSLEHIETLRESNISLYEIPDSKTVEQTITSLENDPFVESVQPNFIYSLATIDTDDTYNDLMWGLERINAPEAWVLGNDASSTDVIVAVIDTGVAYNHPDLLPNMWDGSECVDENGNALGNCNHGYDYEDDDKTPLPTQSSHGTHIAGTIAAVKNNGKGVVGVAPHTKIMSIKAGSVSLTSANIVKSIHFAQENNATIINASWEGPSFDQSIKDAIEAFPGLFVTAAGNSAHDNEITPVFPSNLELPNIISVAATDQNDELAYFSNYGATSVDVSAPGTSIFNTIVTQTLVLDESFDNVVAPGIPDGWSTDGVDTNWGTYDLGGGSKVLYADLAVPYAHNADTNITSPSFNLQNSTAYLQFLTACDTEYTTDWHDYLQLEYSEDGTNFVPAPDPFTDDAFKWSERSLDALKGSPTDEIGSDIGLSAFRYSGILIPEQYLTNNFKFRFHWITNESDNEYDGCLIGEIELSTFSDGSDEHYDFMQGTSMATPHVAGLASLIKGYAPSLSVSQVKDIILTSGDSIPSLTNKTLTGKRINAQNALRSIKAINTFSVPTQVGETTINETTHSITLTVPFGTDVTTLVPSITFAGSTTNPASEIAQDFTAPVTYTVVAYDGTTQDYVVTVQIAAEIIPPVVVTPPPPSGGGGGGSSSGGGGGSSKSKVQINKGAKETRSRNVTLTITKVKDATQMQVSNSPDFGTIAWIPFTNTYPWTLSSSNGNKTVYVRYGKNNKEVGIGKDTISLRESNGGSVVQELPQAPQGSTVGGTSHSPAPQLKFVSTLSVGSRNQEVTDLQNILIAGKYLLTTPATGYYGQITARAVQAYQKAQGIPQTSIVDEATRAKLNGTTVTASANAQKAALIKTLQAKLLELIAELNIMKTN